MSSHRRKFDRDFKVEAVRLVARGTKPLSQVARDLGINENMLWRWKSEMADDPAFAFPGKGNLKPADEELRQLRKQLRDVTEERDILKKALAIFSKTPDRNGDL
jgi:transposase